MPLSLPSTEHLHQLWGPLVRGRRPRRPARSWQDADFIFPAGGTRASRADQGVALHELSQRPARVLGHQIILERRQLFQRLPEFRLATIAHRDRDVA